MHVQIDHARPVNCTRLHPMNMSLYYGQLVSLNPDSDPDSDPDPDPDPDPILEQIVCRPGLGNGCLSLLPITDI